MTPISPVWSFGLEHLCPCEDRLFWSTHLWRSCFCSGSKLPAGNVINAWPASRYVTAGESWWVRSLHKPTLEQSDSKSCASPGVFSFARPGEKKQSRLMCTFRCCWFAEDSHQCTKEIWWSGKAFFDFPTLFGSCERFCIHFWHRKQFEEFGVVEAVEWWKVRQRKSSRLVISFKVQTVQNCAELVLSGEKCGFGLNWKHSCCVWRKCESEGSIRFHHERLISEEQTELWIEACELCYVKYCSLQVELIFNTFVILLCSLQLGEGNVAVFSSHKLTLIATQNISSSCASAIGILPWYSKSDGNVLIWHLILINHESEARSKLCSSFYSFRQGRYHKKIWLRILYIWMSITICPDVEIFPCSW